MLNEVLIIDSGNTVLLTIALGGPNQAPIQIRDISGLEPVKAEITTVPSNLDGELLQHVKLGKRNIVFKFGLDPNWVDQTMASLRRMLYEILSPKSFHKFQFGSDDMEPVEIGGYIESIEPNMFSQDPEMQVSVICINPYFVSYINGRKYIGL